MLLLLLTLICSPCTPSCRGCTLTYLTYSLQSFLLLSIFKASCEILLIYSQHSGYIIVSPLKCYVYNVGCIIFLERRLQTFLSPALMGANLYFIFSFASVSCILIISLKFAIFNKTLQKLESQNAQCYETYNFSTPRFLPLPRPTHPTP